MILPPHIALVGLSRCRDLIIISKLQLWVLPLVLSIGSRRSLYGYELEGGNICFAQPKTVTSLLARHCLGLC